MACIIDTLQRGCDRVPPGRRGVAVRHAWGSLVLLRVFGRARVRELRRHGEDSNYPVSLSAFTPLITIPRNGSREIFISL